MPTFSASKLRDCLLTIHEAAAQPELWPSALTELAGAVAAKGVILIDKPRRGAANSIWTESLNAEMDTFVKEQWWNRNYRFERGLPLARQHGVITETMVCDPRQLDREPLQSEFLKSFGMRWFAGMNVFGDTDRDILFSIDRRSRDEPFSISEIATLRKALPHVRRAGRLAVATSSIASRNILWGLSQLREAAILLDKTGKVIELNDHAERLLGKGLVIVKGELSASHRASNLALQQLVGSGLDLSSEEAREPVAIIRQSQVPLIAHISPLVRSAGDLFSRASALLIFVDPERKPRSPVALLATAFRLSPSESRIALGIARGERLRNIADTHGISLETARVQLKAVFAKTEAHSQAQLVRLLSKMDIG